MRRQGLRREQRGAHRAEAPGSGPLAAVRNLLGSTVPKRVPPPRPLRIIVVSGVIVAGLLFSYSTTQIYLRFAEPNQEPPVPGVTASASPGTGGRNTQAAASTQVDIAVGGSEEDPETDDGAAPEDEGRDRSDGAGQENRDGGDGARQPAPVPQSGTGTLRVSYQKTVYDDSNFMGHLTITNTGSGVLEGWELRVGFSDAQVTSAWGTEWESTQDGFIARQPSWESGIPPGQSTTVSFTAQGSSHTPESCSLNGASCSL